MAGGKGGYSQYDEDYDDGYDDDYYDSFDADDDEPVVAQKKATPVKVQQVGVSKAKGKAAAGKPAPAATAGGKAVLLPAQGQKYPLAPAAPAAEGVTRFQFDSPSPDDATLAARLPYTYTHTGRSAPTQAPVTPSTSAPTQPASSTTPPSSSTAADTAAQALRIADSSGASTSQPAQPPARQPRRPYCEYVLEPDLAAAVRQAEVLEASASGGRSKVHLVVMGHVDAGKSTLMGRLLAELGAVPQKAVHRQQRDAQQAGKASFAWAWLLDERPEERARGVTVDVAVARFQTPRHSVTLLDAPGHRDFVPNMITGASQADAAFLLVDGSPGGFESGFAEPEAGATAVGGGQTREHAQLAKSLGVDQLAVVVTKLDTCAYSQARFEAIRSQLLPFLKACGYREAALQWLPAVGPLGENLTQPPQEPQLLWFKGPTVVQAIDAFQPASRAQVALPLRLPIAEVFKAPRGGMAVAGKLEAGTLKPGSAVMVMPSGEVATVKSVEVDGGAAQLARAGDSVDVVLAGVEAGVLAAGAVVCHPDWPARVAARLEARILLLDLPIPLLRGQQVTIHAHSAREAACVTKLVAVLSPKTGEPTKRNPRCLVKGQTALVEITPSRSFCAESYADYRALGRIALREAGRTLAVGIITSIFE